MDRVSARPGTEVRWAMNTDAEVSIVGGGASLSKGGRTVCATVESGGGAWSVASAQPGNSWESPNPGMRQLVCTATVPESGELVLGISFREVK